MKPLFENWRKFIVEAETTEKTKEYSLKLPRYRISDQWGEPDSEDRRLIENFIARIPGTDFVAKINSLNSFVNDCQERCQEQKDVSEILSNLMFLEVLASVISDFNPNTGGYLFESLLAALLGGKMIPAAKGEIADVEVQAAGESEKWSLKFLFGVGAREQYVKGSKPRLLQGIESTGRPMTYVVAIKNKQHKEDEVLSMDFYKFTVGSVELGIEGDFDAGDVGKEKATPCGTTSGLKMSCVKDGGHLIGTLNFGSKTQLREITNNYFERLGTVLFDIYDQIEQLSNNINRFYLENMDKDAANAADANIASLQANIKELKK